MKHKSILLFAALSFAGCGADTQSEPEAAATRVQPLAWWTGDRVELGGSYDVDAQMISPTPSLMQRIAVESLTVHRPGESSAITCGFVLGGPLGAAILTVVANALDIDLTS